MRPNYLPDADVDAALDRELRDLLTTCFTKKQDVVFRHRRYFLDPYPHRWILRDAEGRLIAHVGVHEKTAEVEGRSQRIAGLAEVCVHPDARGQGHVRHMLREIHAWLARNGFVHAVLFGDPKVYGSSGYREVDSILVGGGAKGWTPTHAMMRELTPTPWPTSVVHLVGNTF